MRSVIVISDRKLDFEVLVSRLAPFFTESVVDREGAYFCSADGWVKLIEDDSVIRSYADFELEEILKIIDKPIFYQLLIKSIAVAEVFFANYASEGKLCVQSIWNQTMSLDDVKNRIKESRPWYDVKEDVSVPE